DPGQDVTGLLGPLGTPWLMFSSFKAFEMEIIPAERIVAQIGDMLILTCNTTGCASPNFSWRTQMDSPLGGKVSNHRTYSTLTMNPVSIVNSHSYLCTVICDDGEKKEKKEKSVKVELYSFPSDPIIEISPSLVAGEQATVICRIPDVYPSDHLEVLLKKDEHVLHREDFQDDDSMNLETKIVTYTFHPMAEDIGKEITCVARLPIADMDFEPKERTSSQMQIVILNANFITKLSIEPSTTVKEGENVSIQCSAESNPPPKIILRRKPDNANMGPYSSRRILLPSVMFQNAGDYECMAENEFGNSRREITLNVKCKYNTMITVIPTAALSEGETVTMKCTSSSNPAPVISWKKKKATGESEKISKNATLTIQNLKSQGLWLYECEACNPFGKEEKAVKLYVQGLLEEPVQMIPLIIAFSSVAAVVVPAVAILIYVSRQAKVNGSYSLVKALRLKV
uniref:Ig-like domain-containing protein n=1 Tax=Cyanistes caeruleus TaxID=156563 RepID=A0A8C0VSF4_CYACU